MLYFNEFLEPLKILRLLSRSVPYYLKSWRAVDETTGLFGSIDPASFNMRSVASSSPVIEYVVRPHLNVLCVLGAFLFLDKSDIISEFIAREECEDRIRKGVRWACETHLTGSRDVDTFLGRKRWGENWRSSVWATLLGVCSVLCRQSLSEELRKRVGEVIAFEADRFTGILPPSGCAIDTKVRENAQDAMALAWAVNLSPVHPHLGEWERALRLWSINIASSIHDRADHTAYLDGSLSQNVVTQNLFPDMTAENHGFFNPEVLAYSAWVVLAAAAYFLHKRTPPDFLMRKNHQRAFDVLLKFCLPNGTIYAPGSHDLPLFIPKPMTFSWGLLHGSARAMTLTARLLSWMDERLIASTENGSGPWVLGLEQGRDGWDLMFQSAAGLELALLACLPFSANGENKAAEKNDASIDTRTSYPYVEVCYRRNIRTTRSVAWKALGGHPIIGFAAHSQPELVAPVKAGLLGIPALRDRLQSWDTVFHRDRPSRDGFDTSGRIRYYNDAGARLLHRDIRIVTWGDEGLLVLDEIIADAPVTLEEHYLSPLYLVNDHWTGGHLDLTSGSLHETFRATDYGRREVQCPSFWACIGTHLLFQLVWGRSKGIYYLPAEKRNAPPLWKNCRLDRLAVRVEAGMAAAGDTVYRTGFYVGTGKSPRPFKSTGTAGEFFKGLVIMDGKLTVGLD
ncbi:MAG: hypothetical protein JXA71_17735 [Chitinispirillaceae bacterium]|nr:hypothetical protein [Chitinispirillaceae bacterium]